MTVAAAREVLDFWFRETKPEQWFEANADFDAAVKSRFEDTWRAARDGRLPEWDASKEGALALVIVLDQFPRNMFRGLADAFATDALANRIAKNAIARGFDLDRKSTRLNSSHT